MRRLNRIALWVCQGALVVMFVPAGVAKFASPMWPQMFARWGYPDHFYLAIGVVEVVAGLALLVPRTAAYAALVLIMVMIGAGLTHLVHAEQHRLPQIIVMSLLLAIVVYARWSDAVSSRAWVS